MEDRDHFDDEPEITPLLVVPEQWIQLSAQHEANNPNNGFAKILEISQEYKNAGMTPVYLYDINREILSLVTQETFGKRLH